MKSEKTVSCSWVFLLPVLLVTASGARAEETVTKLPTTVVQDEAIIAAEPASPVLSVINPNIELPAGQVSDITDLLKDTNSIFIQDSSYGKQVFLRNLGQQDYRILIDGVPVGQMGQFYGFSFPWETIPLESIERIDVTRGAGAAEYGNTLVGTINIITKGGDMGVGGTARWSLGSFMDLQGAATCEGQHYSFDWNAGGSYRSRDPYLANNDLEQWNAFANLGYDFGKWGKVSAYGFMSQLDEGFVLDDRVNWNIWSDSQGLIPGSHYEMNNPWGLISWRSDWVDVGFSVYNYERHDFYDRDEWQEGDDQDFTLGFTAPAVSFDLHHTWGNHSLKIGAEYTYGDASAHYLYYREGTEDIDFKQNLVGVFAQDSWQALPWLNVSLGVRFDYFENSIGSVNTTGAESSDDRISGSGWTPRLSATVDVADGMQIYGFFGGLFKAPSMADLYRWYGNYNLISFAGNAVLRAFYDVEGDIPPEDVEAWQAMLGQLKPSRGYDGELGFRHVGDRFFYSLNFFYEYINDYIVVFPVSYPPTYNIDNVQLWGLELTGNCTITKWLEVEANYTFMQNHKEGDALVERLYDTDKLFNAPENILSVFIRIRPFEGFMAEWQTFFVSSRVTGGAPGVPPQKAKETPKYDPILALGAYDLENLQLSYTPGTWKFITPKIAFAVQNIFDRRDYIRLDYPLPGRLFYGGLSATF